MIRTDINERLHNACYDAVIIENRHICHINISPEALSELGRYSHIHCENRTMEDPITWYGVELKECQLPYGLEFELITKECAKTVPNKKASHLSD